MLSATTGGHIGNDANRLVVQALDNVSLTLRDGDRLALIGHNGAGKTTLLRVLAGIFEPLKGEIRVTGRVTPMFDVSLGIDPESTGYENIILRGMYLGLSKAERSLRFRISIIRRLCSIRCVTLKPSPSVSTPTS